MPADFVMHVCELNSGDPECAQYREAYPPDRLCSSRWSRYLQRRPPPRPMAHRVPVLRHRSSRGSLRSCIVTDADWPPVVHVHTPIVAYNLEAPGVVAINGIPIRNVTMGEAIGMIDDCIVRRERRCVFFVNAHCVNISARDRAYRELLQRGDALLFGDGIGVRIAAALKRQRMKDNVNGTDMLPLICEHAVRASRSLFLLGARPGVADEMARRLSARYAGLRIAGVQHGYFQESETDSLVARINHSGRISCWSRSACQHRSSGSRDIAIASSCRWRSASVVCSTFLAGASRAHHSCCEKPGWNGRGVSQWSRGACGGAT